MTVSTKFCSHACCQIFLPWSEDSIVHSESLEYWFHHLVVVPNCMFMRTIHKSNISSPMTIFVNSYPFCFSTFFLSNVQWLKISVKWKQNSFLNCLNCFNYLSVLSLTMCLPLVHILVGSSHCSKICDQGSLLLQFSKVHATLFKIY